MASMPSLLIEQQYAQIGITTTNAKVHVVTPRPQMRIINNGMPQMEVERKDAEFTVDWQRVREESGLAGPVKTSLTSAAKGKEAALNYVSEAVHSGDYLAKLEEPGNRVARLERQKSLQDSQKELNIGSMPQSFPDIQWDPGYINISWSTASLQVEWEGDYLPTFSVEPHSVEIFLRNRPYLRITVVEENIAKTAGRHVDQQV